MNEASRPLPSASSLHRAIACRASSALPMSPDRAGEDAERGQCLHGYTEAIANGVEERVALAAVPEAWRGTACDLDVGAILMALGWDPFGDQEMHAEEAFAWNPRTDVGRSLGLSLNRDYSGATADEAVGTADVILVDRGAGRIVVADYKFGHGHVARARENLQVRALARYATRAYGMNRATVILVRGREDGSAWLDVDEMEEVDLDATGDVLMDLAQRIAVDRERGDAPATAGEHCRYCRSAPHCPLGPMALVAADGGGFARLRATPEGREKLLALRVLAKKLPELIDAELRDAIAEGAVSLPGGMELAIETTERRKVDDAGEVWAALQDRFGEAVADVAAPLVRSATITTIKAAAKLRAAKGQTKAIEAELLATCEAAGAVKLSTSESIIARRVPSAGVAA